MNNIQGNFGTIYFTDCIPELKQYHDDEFDLCITDPPWNVEYEQYSIKTRKHHGRTLEYKQKDFYQDKGISFEWFDTWFDELLRICKCVCMYLGAVNFTEWIRYKHEIPCSVMFHYFTNGHTTLPHYNFTCYNAILVYKKPIKRFNTNVMNFMLEWGFVNKDKFIHPTPKSAEIYERLITQSKSMSVIDPFAGSGTIAEASEYCGVKYLGYEQRIEYEPDIAFRMKRGIQRYQQKQIKKLSKYES